MSSDELRELRQAVAALERQIEARDSMLADREKHIADLGRRIEYLLEPDRAPQSLAESLERMLVEKEGLLKDAERRLFECQETVRKQNERNRESDLDVQHE